MTHIDGGKMTTVMIQLNGLPLNTMVSFSLPIMFRMAYKYFTTVFKTFNLQPAGAHFEVCF
jgi:hypothetical protein